MNIFVLMLSLYIVGHCISILTKMDSKTSNSVYAYHVIFSTASFFLFVSILDGHQPTFPEFLFVVGISVSYLFNKRSKNYELRKE